MVHQIRILLVEHSLPTLSQLYINLISEDYNVEATNEAIEVIPRLQRFQPQLVIINKDMPEINYVEICRQLKQMHVPLILILDKPTTECIQIDGCCINEYLVKPVNLCMLKQLINEMSVVH